MIERILPTYFFTLECLLLYFLLFFSYIQLGELPPTISFLLIALLANLIFYILKRKQVIHGIIPFIAAVLLGAIGYFLGFTLLTILICSVFVYLRLNAFLKDSLLWSSDRTKLAITFYGISFFIFLEGWMFGYPHMNWLFAIVIFFTGLFMIGRFLQRLDMDFRLNDIIPLVSVLGISAVLTGLVTILVYMGKWLFFKIMGIIAMIASMIGIPLFQLLQLVKFDIGRKSSPFLNIQKQMKELQIKDDAQYLSERIPTGVYLGLFVIVLLLIGYFVSKRRSLVDNYSPKQVMIEMENVELSADKNQKRRLFRQPTPEEYMRKLFLQLHLSAEKHQLGRHPHETIREWFHRVGFPRHEELLQAYESVRYGRNDIPKEDAAHLAQVIEQLKREMRERSRGAQG